MPNTSAMPLQITVNGAPYAAHAGLHVSDLIAQLALDPRAVAIELNHAIVPRSTYDTTTIATGDAVEIVGFIGGG